MAYLGFFFYSKTMYKKYTQKHYFILIYEICDMAVRVMATVSILERACEKYLKNNRRCFEIQFH